MRIITRFISLQMLSIFVLSLLGSLATLTLTLVLVTGRNMGIPLNSAMMLTFYTFPEATVFSLPLATILSVSFFYVGMATRGELNIFRSLGIRPRVLLAPALLLGLILSLSGFFLADISASWGRTGVAHIAKNSLKEILYGKLRQSKRLEVENVSLTVGNVEGERILQPVIRLGNDHFLRATEAQILVDYQSQMVNILFVGMDTVGSSQVSIPYSQSFQFPIERVLSGIHNSSSTPSAASLSELKKQEKARMESLKARYKKMAFRAMINMNAGNPLGLADSEWNILHRECEADISKLHRIHTEPHRRCSLAMSPFFFAWLLGLLAIRYGKYEMATFFLCCILVCIAVYFPLYMTTLNYAKNGSCSPWFLWTPNAVALGACLYFSYISD